METLIVLLLIALAVAWLSYRAWRARHAGRCRGKCGCGSGKRR